MRERLRVQRRQAAPQDDGWSEHRHQQRDFGQAATAVEAEDLSGGAPLDATTRASFEPRFGHDFSQVSIFDDARAAESAMAFDARAYTVGTDIVFGAGQYAPEAESGRRLLAHELAHVVQDSGATRAEHKGPAPRLSERGDPDERAAHAAAHGATTGRDVRVPAAPVGKAAAIHRWPWDDDSPEKSASGGGDGGGGGGSLWDSAKSAISTVGEGVAGGAEAAYKGYQSATDFRGAANDLGKGVDWVEQKAAAGNQKMVEDAKGIPVLEQLAQASAFVGTQTTDLTGGMIKGAGDLVSGAGNAIFHPIDAAAGIEGILEHNATIPGLSTTLKAGHGLYDLAANGGGQYGGSLGDVANHAFNPLQQMEDDQKYDSDLARGILTPGAKTWDESWQRVKDNPMDTLGRAGVNIAPMVLGVGEAGLGEDAAQAGRVVEPGPPVPEAPPTLRTPYKPPGVPEPAPFNPDITGPPSVEPPGPAPAEAPGPASGEPANPSSRPSYQPTGSRGDWAHNPGLDLGDPPPSTPPGFEGQPRPFPAPRTPSPLFPDQLPDFGVIEEPGPGFSERPPNTVLEEPPSSAPAPDTIPGGPEFPKPPGTPIAPEFVKLPGGPKEGPPIPREDPLSTPPDTARQPIDIPGIPPEEPLPSTQPRGPETEPEPA